MTTKIQFEQGLYEVFAKGLTEVVERLKTYKPSTFSSDNAPDFIEFCVNGERCGRYYHAFPLNNDYHLNGTFFVPTGDPLAQRGQKIQVYYLIDNRIIAKGQSPFCPCYVLLFGQKPDGTNCYSLFPMPLICMAMQPVHFKRVDNRDLDFKFFSTIYKLDPQRLDIKVVSPDRNSYIYVTEEADPTKIVKEENSSEINLLSFDFGSKLLLGSFSINRHFDYINDGLLSS